MDGMDVQATFEGLLNSGGGGSEETYHLQSRVSSPTYDDTTAPLRTVPKAKGDKEGERECPRGKERERTYTQRGETATTRAIVVDGGGG